MSAIPAYTLRAASWQRDEAALRSVRESVFVQEQHVPPELEWDGLDAHCLHLLAVDAAGRALGTARLLLADGILGRMAVLKPVRGCGIGSALLARMVEEAKKRQMQEVVLNAQLRAQAFYTRFGFRGSGETFSDAGICHIRMSLKLT
ncbi:GNAT family N-acetyltransferase [Nitrosovibrio sp. Nv17]|uniref:GNAT family N-acetyltransferase n=1 Tax=Nitrosovibrio sp. Nv17 TaxID=1855339 RepID=UPI0021018AE2|nr:GNAT family N-acetyltransferase [Nitrosovibrio sp. Nv17]